jgi:hypothetical protein
MAWLFAAPLVVFLVVLAAGAVTGRVRTRSCCTPTDPRDDLRMRSAFPADESDVE